MLRLILFMLVSLVLMGLTVWTSQIEGGVTVVLDSYRIYIPHAVAMIAALGLFIGSGVVWALVYALLQGPSVIGKRIKRNRERDALDRLARGFIALAAGDSQEAQRCSTLTRKKLDNHPAQLLLSAQVSEAKANNSATRAELENMLGNEELQNVGRCGLYRLHIAQNDYKAALEHAAAAFDASPHLLWAGRALFEVQCRGRNWEGALETLKKLEKREVAGPIIAKKQRYRAVLLTAMAMDLPPEQSEKSLEMYQKAWKLDNSLIAAASFAAVLLGRTERYAQAEKMLKATWNTFRHPDIADIYARLRPGASAKTRLERVKSLVADGSDIISAMALARAAIQDNDWTLAEETLRPHGMIAPTQGLCLMMAEIIGHDEERSAESRQWLNRAKTAMADQKWIADGIAFDSWGPIAPITGVLDAMEWKSPVSLSDQPPTSLLRREPAQEANSPYISSKTIVDGSELSAQA